MASPSEAKQMQRNERNAPLIGKQEYSERFNNKMCRFSQSINHFSLSFTRFVSIVCKVVSYWSQTGVTNLSYKLDVKSGL